MWYNNIGVKTAFFDFTVNREALLLDRERVAILHGYETKRDPETGAVVPGKLMEAYCARVVTMMKGFTKLFLLGGQHNPGIKTLLAETMRARLVELGIPRDKILSWTEIPNLCHYMPARDTAEEAVLASRLMCCGYFPKNAEYTEFIASEFLDELLTLHVYLGIQCSVVPVETGALSETGRENCRRTAQVACKDPFRVRDEISVVKRRLRTQRPAAPDCVPLITLPEEQDAGYKLPQ